MIRPKKIIVNISLALLSLLILLLLAEAGIRIFYPQPTGPIAYSFHPELGEIPFPNQKARTTIPGIYSFKYCNNSLGLRGEKEFSYKKTVNKRVLLLGDSFTYGTGVNDDQVLGIHLENILLEKGFDIEVINAGNPGKGTGYPLKFYSTYGYRCSPDLIIYFVFFNDFYDNLHQGYYLINEDGTVQPNNLDAGFYKKKAFLVNVPGYNWMKTHTHLVNIVRQALVGYILRKGKARQRAALLADAATDSSGERISNEDIILSRKTMGILLGELNRKVKESNGELMVFFLPCDKHVDKFRESGTFSQMEQSFFIITDSLGIDSGSLTETVASSDLSIEELYFQEGHWTPPVHRLAAIQVADVVARRLQGADSL